MSTYFHPCFYVTVFLFLCSIAFSAPLTSENALWNTRSNRIGHTYYPSKSDWRSTICFQLMTDRFYDGCPTNNEQAYGGFDITDRNLRHGGDFAGVTRKVDYLKGLGVDMIWVSPVFQNEYNSYHGYGQLDRTLIDKRWGTLIDFRQMIDSLHDEDLLICIDEVSNHGANLLYGAGGQNNWPMFHMHTDEHTLHYYDAGKTHQDYTVDNTYSATGDYGSNYDTDGNKVYDTGSGGFFADDFHHNGECSFDSRWRQWLGEFPGVGYDDYATERASCIATHIDTFNALLNQGVDAIREDTPMEMLNYFFQKWCPAARDHALTLGKSNFFMFGEYFTSYAYADVMTGTGADGTNPFSTRTNDFALNSGVNYRAYFDFFRPAIFEQNNGNLGTLKSTTDKYLSPDNYGDKDGGYDFRDWADGESKFTMLNFYNNHDQPRLSTWNDGDAKTRLASGIILTWPGIPCFYHGDEQGFKTTFDGDKNVREDYAVSAAYVTDSGVTNRARGDNFNMTHENYKWIAKIANYRRLYPALWQTDTYYERWMQSNADNGIYAFTRVWGDPTNWVLIVFNTWSGSLSYGPLATGWDEGDTIVNLMNPSETYTLTAGGNMSYSCVGYGLQIWALDSNVRALSPVGESVSPAHDEWEKNVSANVVVTFSKAMNFASVTNAFRFDGKTVPPSTLSLDGTSKQLTYNPATDFSDGIHFVEILTNAFDSTDGLSFYANFSSRFRVGSITNPVVNYDLTSDDTLINNGGGYSNVNVTLMHKATGAEWFRVKNDGGSWSDWQSYTNVSAWTLDGVGGQKKVWVQYWCDGSAAFIISDTVEESTTLHADFTATPLSGIPSLSVSFTNDSTIGAHAITAYEWNFGDSNSSTNQHPQHTYSQSGIYSVSLTVDDEYSQSSTTKVHYISVYTKKAGDDIEDAAYTDDTFAGKNGGTGFNAWAVPWAGGGTWRETGADKISGSRSLGTWDQTADADQLGVKREFAAAWSNKHVFTFSFRPKVYLHSGKGVYIYLRNGNDDAPYTGQRLALYLSSDGNIYVYDGSDHDTGADYTYASHNGHVFDVSLTVDPENNTYSYSITDRDNGSNTGSGNGTQLAGTSGSPLHSFSLRVDTADTQHNVIWDDFLLTTSSDTLLASFTATPTNGPAPLSVQFTDASSGSPDAWAWDFDNDGTYDSSSQNPQHEFPTQGIYTVTLIVSNGTDAAVSTSSSYIIVGASVTPDPPLGIAPTTSTHRVDIAWQKNAANDPVILVQNADGNFTVPANGTEYSTGQNALGGTVIYTGSDEFTSTTNVVPDMTYYYALWSVNSMTNYSLTSVNTNVTTKPFNPPSSVSTTSHSLAIDLTWSANSAGNPVIIVRNTSGIFYDPIDGTEYSVSEQELGGTIVYKGAGTSFEDMGLQPDTHYYYALWSYNSEESFTYYSSSYASADDFTGNAMPDYIDIDFTSLTDGDLFYATQSITGGWWFVEDNSYKWRNTNAPMLSAKLLSDGVRDPYYSGGEFTGVLKAYAGDPFQRAGVIAHYYTPTNGAAEFYSLMMTNANDISLQFSYWSNSIENVRASIATGCPFDESHTYTLVLRMNEDNSVVGSLKTGTVVVAQINSTGSEIEKGRAGLITGYGSGTDYSSFSTAAPEPSVVLCILFLCGLLMRGKTR